MAPGEGGAESDHYERLTPTYAAKNGPFDSVEELLLVKDFTTEILYGEDANRNGVLDPNEDDGDESLPPDDHDGELDGGLTEFVTVYSYTRNRTLEGQPRVNINEAEREALTQALGEQLPPPKITWIAEYRKAKLGGQSIFPDEQYVTPANVVPVIPVPGVPGQPLTFDDYRKIADLVTVTSEARIEGKINVNTAPKEVLQALPQITDEEADEILTERENEERDLSNPTWVYDVLLGSGMEKLAKYTALEPFIDVRSRQFTVQAVGVVPGRGVMVRIVAVIDRTVAPPQLLYWKDISGLGLAFRPPTREAWDSEAGEGH